MLQRVSLGVLLVLVALLLWDRIGGTVAAQRGSRYDMTNQGGGIFTIQDTRSGACFVMVDRGGSAGVTIAPKEAC